MRLPEYGKEQFKVTEPHEKIHFSRRDVKKFCLFPSICTPDGIKLRMPRRRYRLPRFVRRMFVTSFTVVLILFILSVVILKVGIRGEILLGKMQEALSEKLGDFAIAELHDARLSLDSGFHIALEAQNVKIHGVKGNIKLDHIGSIKLGLSTTGLMQGKVQVIQVGVHDTEITMLENDDVSTPSLLQNTDRPFDFDSAGEMLFTSLDRLLAGFDKQSTKSLVLEDITLHGVVHGKNGSISINRLKSWNSGTAMQLDGEVAWNGRVIGLAGKVMRDSNGKTQKFTLTAEHVPLHLGAEDNVSPYYADGRVNNRLFRLHGNILTVFEGTQATVGTPRTLSLSVLLADGDVDIGAHENIRAQVALNSRYVAGSGVLEIQPSRFLLGGLNIPFHGSLDTAPETKEKEGAGGRYRFRLLANNAVSAPQTSPAPPLKFSAEVGGEFQAGAQEIVFDKLLLQAGKENLAGRGKMRFGDGSPETIFVLQTPRMPVDKAKQLWPLNISPDTRLWVLTHIFGGQLANMTMEIALPSGFFKAGEPPRPLTEKELKITTGLENIRSDLIGKLPALRETYGQVNLRGTTTEIKLERGIAYVGNNERLAVSRGVMTIPWVPLQPVVADLSLHIQGEAASVGKLASYEPVNFTEKIPFEIRDISGEVDTLLKLNFPLGKNVKTDMVKWDINVGFKKFALAKPYQGKTAIREATGNVQVNRQEIALAADGLLNNIPAHVEMRWPMTGDTTPKQEKIVFYLDDNLQKKFIPGLDSLLSGTIAVDVGPEQKGVRHIVADLSKASLQIPWIGWKKGNGIAATAEMTVPADIAAMSNMEINDFSLKGATFQLLGKIIIRNSDFSSAEFSKVVLNRDDDIHLSIQKNGSNYQIGLTGGKFDARALIKQTTGARSSGGEAGKIGGEVTVNTRLDQITGFYGETLSGFKASYKLDRAGNSSLSLDGMAQSKYPVSVQFTQQQGAQTLLATSQDAGALLRFANLYDKAHGGRLEAKLQSDKGAPLSGPISLYNFQIINEPKLASIVSTSSVEGGKSLNDAVKDKIDVAQVFIQRAFGHIAKGDNFLVLDQGVIRGPTIGATFQGVVYDASGNIDMTGTFMPGYGLNRIFADLPIVGAVLGNGRDRGLIGITFKVEGSAKAPRVIVNPISAIAPGIFRSIFEFK